MEALGLAALGVAVAVVAMLLAYLNRAFVETVRVSASIPLTGAPLPVGSEVKARGVVVGRITDAQVVGERGILTLELNPADAELLPLNVTSRALPATLFGKEFLDLVVPAEPQGTLVAGTTIREDTAPQSIETQRLLADTFPLLASLHPAELDAALTAVAQALDGRGEQIGTSLDTLDGYLRELAPHHPALVADIQALATASDRLADAVPDLAGTVRDLATTTRTVAEKREALGTFLATGATAATALDEVLSRNERSLVAMSPALQQVLRAFDANTTGVARTAKSIPDFLDALVRVSGGNPYFRIELQLDGVSRGVYTSADCPRYPGAEGPNCPDGSTSSRYGGAERPAATTADRTTVRDALAPLLGVPADEVPSTTELLVGPLLGSGPLEVR
jgi:phospholipid/cholesterol/gamma-HCH transport system substrate-binding protein